MCSSMMAYHRSDRENGPRIVSFFFFPKLDFIHIYINMHVFMLQDERLTSLLKKLTGMILSQC